MSTIRKRGSAYQAIVRVKKHGAIIHQEARSFATEALARDWANRLEAAIEKKGVEHRVTTQVTLAKLIEMHVEQLEKAKPLRPNRLGEFSQLMDSEPGRTKLNALSSDGLVRWANTRRASGAGPATVLHNLATIRAVLNSAKPLFGIEVTSAAAVEAIAALSKMGGVSGSASRDRRLHPDEEAALMAEFARTAGSPTTIIPMAKIMQVALHLPRRREEIINKITWAGLDKRRHTATLKDVKHPRKVRDETVPVPKAAWDIILAMPVVDERVFPFNPESVSAAFQGAVARLGIVDLRFHDLRHEGISRLFEKGLEIQEVALISGHLSWNMLRRYTHLRPETVLEKLDGRKQNDGGEG